MKKYILFIFTFCFFIMFSSSVIAEECDSTKIENLKKQADVVSAVSQFDEDSVSMGIFNSNIVSIYGLNDGLYATNKGHTIIFSNSDSIDGVVSKIIDSDFGTLNVYSIECPSVILKSFKLDLKRLNKYYNYDECKDIKDEIDICSRFYDTSNISYSVFLSEIEKFRKNNKKNIISEFNIIKFIKDNIFITIGIGLVIFSVIIALVFIKYRNNKLD